MVELAAVQNRLDQSGGFISPWELPYKLGNYSRKFWSNGVAWCGWILTMVGFNCLFRDFGSTIITNIVFGISKLNPCIIPKL